MTDHGGYSDHLTASDRVLAFPPRAARRAVMRAACVVVKPARSDARVGRDVNHERQGGELPVAARRGSLRSRGG